MNDYLNRWMPNRNQNKENKPMTVLEQQFYETMCRTMKSISNSLETICVKLDNIEKQLSKDETQNEIENEEKEDNER